MYESRIDPGGRTIQGCDSVPMEASMSCPMLHAPAQALARTDDKGHFSQPASQPHLRRIDGGQGRRANDESISYGLFLVPYPYTRERRKGRNQTS
jgi:hypothetical protein